MDGSSWLVSIFRKTTCVLCGAGPAIAVYL
jgi:hypothetical protein